MSKRVLITGGSSGIGYSMSRYFAKAAYHLLWVSLLEEEIEAAKQKLRREFTNCNVDALVQDLSKPEAAQNVYNWVVENNWNIDTVINNAGIGTYGFVPETNLEKELTMINLNVRNVYNMTRFFLEDMVIKNVGTIINISSISSFQPSPKLSTYGATKAFVNHFSRSVNEELKMKGSKVKVICVCPAAIRDTNFKTSGNMENVKTFDGMVTTTSEEVAKDIWKGYMKRKDFIVSGRKMRWLYRISGLIPYRIQQILVRKEVKEVG